MNIKSSVDARIAALNKRDAKKTAAQLDREINAALGGGSAGSGTAAKVPPLKDWSMSAGGSFAAPGKHGYSVRLPHGEYHINPTSSPRGRHLGCLLKYAATGGTPRGSHGGLWHDLGTHRSAATAAVAARKHYAAAY